jgi:1-acyl-sn-glycerol-3-phosphate acyltransferase
MTPAASPLLFRLFARHANWYVRRSFHSVRVAQDGLPPDVEGRPAVVYLNHASWWDPLIAILLATHYWPSRKHFAPIDAEALGKYRLFAWLGFFPIEQGTRRGARQFLEMSAAIVADPSAMLWVTPQGRFTDPRSRPIALQPGLAHLARHSPQAAFIPLAIEYPFWQERLPEALCRFSPAISAEQCSSLAPALQQNQDALAELAIAQDAQRFESILRGRVGVGKIYDSWRRMRAMLAGQRFDPGHGGEPA